MPKKPSGPRALAGEVVLVGIEGSGKSLMCRHLERITAGAAAAGDGKKKSKKNAIAAEPAPLNAATQPSIGVNLVEVPHRDHLLSVRECGGTMQPVWPQYLEKAAAVVFVADTATAEGCSGAVAEVCDVLKRAPERVLLFLNKRDAPGALPEETVRLLFGLDALEKHNAERLTVLAGSALGGEGLSALLDWCVDAVVEREKLEAELHTVVAAKEAQQKANEAQAAAINAAAEAGAPAPPAGGMGAAEAPAAAPAKAKSRRPWRKLKASVSAANAFRDADKFAGAAPAAAER